MLIMRKFLLSSLICVCGLFVFSFVAFAETTEDGLFDYEIMTDEENGDLVFAQITKYNGEVGGDLTLPDELGGYPVMSLASDFLSFQFNSEHNVQISEHFDSIRLPKNLSDFTVTSCFKWTEKFVISEENEWFCTDEYGAFYDKEKTYLYAYPVFGAAKEYSIPETVVSDDYVYSKFIYCRYLERLVVPGEIKKIGSTFCTYANSLRELILREGVEEIDENCTGVCNAMERVVMPSTLTKIGHHGLSGLRKVKELVIPAAVNYIGYAGLSDNKIMERVVFLGVPDTVEWMGGVFGANPMLKDIYFVGTQDEWNASPIARYVPEGVTLHFGADYITENDVMIDYKDALLSLKGGSVNGGAAGSLFPWDFYAGECEMLSCAADVKQIGAYAFHDFTELSEIVIYGDGVTVAKNAFAGCEKLDTVVAFGDIAFEDGALPVGAVVYAPAGAEVSCGGRIIRFSYEDGVLSLNGEIDTDAYEFLDVVAVLCDRLGTVERLDVSSLHLDGVEFYYKDENGRKRRIEDDTLVNGTVIVGVPEEDGEDRELTFNELCEGIADGTLTGFYFSTATQEHGENIDTPVELSLAERVQESIQRVLKAIVTLLNRLFRFLKNLGK